MFALARTPSDPPPALTEAIDATIHTCTSSRGESQADTRDFLPGGGEYGGMLP
jgi:hypothetical protein